MNCNRVQNLLSAYIDCELDPEEKRELRKHLVFCIDCNREYEELVKLKSCLNNLTQDSFAFDPLADLKLRLANESKSIVPEIRHFILLGRFGVIAGCLILFFLTTLSLFPEEKSPNIAEAPNLTAPVVLDQNISLDQSVTVYQASLMIP